MNAHLDTSTMFRWRRSLEPAMREGWPHAKAVIGPLGEPLTLESLPPGDCNRWTPRRKAEVVTAVKGGLLTQDDACSRYNLSREEFASWQLAAERSGMPGLRATRAQFYKNPGE